MGVPDAQLPPEVKPSAHLRSEIAEDAALLLGSQGLPAMAAGEICEAGERNCAPALLRAA